MHDLLFEYNHALQRDDLIKYATQLKLNINQFTACLDDSKTQERLKRDIEEARQLKVTSTPSFYIDGWKFSGVYSVKKLQDTLKSYAHRPASKGPIVDPAPLNKVH
jgi:protein-disulfide isomerase